MSASAQEQDHRDLASSTADCHGSQGNKDAPGPTDMPDGAMAAACLVAAAVSMPSPVIEPVSVQAGSEHPSATFLLPPSVAPAPPDKPPQA